MSRMKLEGNSRKRQSQKRITNIREDYQGAIKDIRTDLVLETRAVLSNLIAISARQPNRTTIPTITGCMRVRWNSPHQWEENKYWPNIQAIYLFVNISPFSFYSHCRMSTTKLWQLWDHIYFKNLIKRYVYHI